MLATFLSGKVATEDQDESEIPVEEAVELDTSDTPAEGGDDVKTVEEAADDAAEAEAEETNEVNPDEASDADGLTEDNDETSEDSEESNEEGSTDTESDDENAEGDEDITDVGEDEEEAELTDEEKEDAAKSLEEIRDAITETLERGGMTESEATVADMAIQDVAERANINNCRMVASVESFSERSSRRILATNRAIDNLNFYIAQLRS